LPAGGAAGRRGFFFLNIDDDTAEPPCHGAKVRASLGWLMSSAASECRRGGAVSFLGE
jgi:hypothetical protein